MVLIYSIRWGVVKNDIVKLFDTIKSYRKFLAFLIDDENLQQKTFCEL
jgi:hypothetical protein